MTEVDAALLILPDLVEWPAGAGWPTVTEGGQHLQRGNLRYAPAPSRGDGVMKTFFSPEIRTVPTA